MGVKIWLDIETTGLDPNTDEILEVGVYLTEAGPGLDTLWYDSYVRPVNVDKAYLQASPYVQEMHAKSGLWDDLARVCPTGDPDILEVCRLDREFLDRVVEQVKKYAPDHRPGPICGSSPQFDAGFLHVQLPGLRKLFNHRVYDVSTLTETLSMGGLAWADISKEAAHRVISDLQWSIGQARHFCKLFFEGPDGVAA